MMASSSSSLREPTGSSSSPARAGDDDPQEQEQDGSRDLILECFPSDDLLSYIGLRASNLRRMQLRSCKRISDETFVEAVKSLPMLEELDVSLCYLSSHSLEAAGECCPRLTSLNFNMPALNAFDRDAEAIAIAKTMPNLKHLELIENRLTNAGLQSILDACPLLQHLDLRRCFNLCLEASLGARCVQQIKELLFPDDYYHDPSVVHSKWPWFNLCFEASLGATCVQPPNLAPRCNPQIRQARLPYKYYPDPTVVRSIRPVIMGWNSRGQAKPRPRVGLALVPSLAKQAISL